MSWLVFSIITIVLGFLAVVLWSLIAVSQAMDCEDVDLPDALRASVEGFRVRGISDERMRSIAEDWENHKRECMDADSKRLSAIREALTLEMPPLSLADQRFLFFMATGETIERLPRCAWCHGDGSVEQVMNGEAIPVKCGNCNGTGFTR